MKTIYAAVIFFLAFSVAFSQPEKRFAPDELQSPKGKKAEIQSNPAYLVESVVAYQVNGEKEKYSYTYDENGNLITDFKEKWENDEWVNSWRETYTYDENGNLITDFKEKWENDEWVNSWRETYTYDENGNRLTYFSEVWADDEWVYDGRVYCSNVKRTKG